MPYPSTKLGGIVENLPTTQNQNLPAKDNFSRRLLSWAVNSGQFVIALSESASIKWADHKGRVAASEAMAQLLLEEGKAAVDLKKKLIEKLVGADEVEAAQVRLLLNQVDADIRTLGILHKANNEIKAIPTETSVGKEEENKEINCYWLDKFFDLTKLKNEPWRAGLLSKALAFETVNPGGISLETLWKIGTLSETSFHALAHLLDVSPLVSGVPIIVNPTNKFYSTNIQNSMIGENAQYGTAVLLLDEAGLIHLPASMGAGAKRNFPGKGVLKISYGKNKEEFSLTQEFSLKGILFTELGVSLASLYEAVENNLGEENFKIVREELIKFGCQPKSI